MLLNFNKKQITKLSFLIISFFLIIIPITNINQNNSSKMEMRELSSYKPIYDRKSKSLNFNYGKDFENYLKDRFCFRIQCINLYNSIKYTIEDRYVKLKTVIIDKHTSFSNLQFSTEIYSKETQKEIISQLKIFNQYCNKHKIKLYILIVPQKEMVYAPGITKIDNNQRIKENIANIKKDSKCNIIFPLNEFITGKYTIIYPMFYATDSHATVDGAFIAYQSLIKNIKKDFPFVPILNTSDFDYSFDKKVLIETHRKLLYGNNCKYAGISLTTCMQLHNTENRFYHHKKSNNIKMDYYHSKYLTKKTFFYPEGANLKLLIFGDSFSENLLDIIPYSFKHTIQIRLNAVQGIAGADEQYKIMKYYEKEINNIKPDIIVIYVGYSFSENLKYLTKK